MVLPSQMQQRRSGSGYASTSSPRRRRKPRRLLVGIVVLAVVGYFGWGWIFGSSDEAVTDAPADPVASAPPEGAITPEPTSSAGLSGSVTPPRPAPFDSQRPKPSPVPAPAPEVPAPAPKPAAVTAKPTPQPETPAPTPTPAPSSAPAVAVAPSPKPASLSGPTSVSDAVKRLIEASRRLVSEDQAVRARVMLNDARKQARGADAAALRKEMAKLNQEMVFSPAVHEGDPYSEAYLVQPGDALSKIGPKYNVPWRFISKINNNLDPRRLRVGARLKVVKGPFHAVVYKDKFRMDLFLGEPDSGMYVRSFNVGLGEHGATPLGSFIVKKHSKLVNPEWVNPRTGERFLADDPKNPLGEYWLGLQGTDANTEALLGYGIHGTIEPDTIGTEASMGCVRLLDDDIAMVFAMLSEQQSQVIIR